MDNPREAELDQTVRGSSEATIAHRTLGSVLLRIQEAYRGMTPRHRTIAEYVLQNHQELAFAPVARIAELIGVSAATIIRFAESLGLSGFSELQALARDAIRQEVSTVVQFNRTVPTADADSILVTSLRADMG